MNKLQIIEEVFGPEFTPHVLVMHGSDVYYAKKKSKVGAVLSYKLEGFQEGLKKHNASLSVDFYDHSFLVHFK